MSENLKILEELTWKLETKENQMRAFFELSIDPMVISNETHFELVNDAWIKEFGWSQMEMNDRPWRTLLHPDDVGRTEVAHRRLIGNIDVLKFQNRFRCTDGSHKTLEWNAKVTPSGKYYCVARVVRNG